MSIGPDGHKISAEHCSQRYIFCTCSGCFKNTEQEQHCEFIALWQDLKAEVARRQATLIRPLAGSPEQGLSILYRQLRLRSVLRMWSALVYSKLCQLSSGSQLLLKLHGPGSKAVPDKSHLPGGPGVCCLPEAVRLQPLAMPTQEGSCTQSPTSPREYDMDICI